MVVIDNPLPKATVSNTDELYSSEVEVCRSITPVSIDCLSSNAESDHETSFGKPLTRDPSLLRERLETSFKSKAQGKRKNRKENFEREISNLGGNIKVDFNHMEFHPHKSSFTELFNSTSNMKAWEAFTSLSEEDQRNFLKSNEPKLSRRTLYNIEEEKTDVYIDARAIHPASVELCRCSKMSSVVSGMDHKENKTKDAVNKVKGREDYNECFEICKPLEKDCCWNIEILSNAFSEAELLQGHRKLSLIGTQFSVLKKVQNFNIPTGDIRRFGFDELICFIELGSESTVTGCILFRVENNAVRDCITSALYRTILRFRMFISQCVVSESNKRTFQTFISRDYVLPSHEDLEQFSDPEESDNSNSSFEVISESEL